MLKNWIIKMQKVAIYSMAIASLASLPSVAKAQISPDGTLPTEVQVEGNVIEITGGGEAGNNLFHSFSEFSIPEGLEAYFNNGGNIENIINRVTGGNISVLEGVLRANGFANVIILNPAGFEFNGFELNIGGGFLTTTADGLVFSDGTVFSTDVNQPVNLTINVPIGIQWNGDQSDALIVVNDTTARTADDRYFTMVGGEVIVTNSQIEAPGGRVEIGGVKGAGVVEIGEDGSLVFPEEIVKANIEFQQSVVDVRSGGGGAISFNAADLLLNGSEIRAGIGEGLGNPEAVAGDIRINATNLEVLNGGIIVNATEGMGNGGNIVIDADGRVKVDGGEGGFSAIAGAVFQGAQGNAGNIEINANSLEVVNGGQIFNSTFGVGNAGNIAIKVDNLMKVDGEEVGFGGIFNNVQINQGEEESIPAQGNAGIIEIDAETLEILNGGVISANTSGLGNGGRVKITATGQVLLNNGDITTEVALTGVGNGGGIEIDAATLEILNGGNIAANTSGLGNGGNIAINAQGILINNAESESFTGITSSVFSENAEVNGGEITINSKTLDIFNGSQIGANVLGKGNGGVINIIVEDGLIIDRAGSESFTGVRSDVFEEAEGNAGGININTETLEVLNGGRISADTSGLGNAGNITINANNLVQVDGFITLESEEESFNSSSAITSNVNSNATGDAGGVEINTNSLEVLNEGIITANTFGLGNGGIVKIEGMEEVLIKNGSITSTVGSGATGNAGGIEINTSSLRILDNSLVNAGVLGVGNGGNVMLNVDSLEMLNNSFIGGDVFGKGNAGVIQIDATGAIVINDSSIFSNVGEETEGNAGEIKINASSLEVMNNSFISTATFGKGDGGGIMVNVKDLLISEVSGIYSNVFTTAEGNGGEIEINASSLEVMNNSVISTATFGKGDGGVVIINVDDLLVSEGGQINSNVLVDAQGNMGEGNAGGVQINAGKVEVLNGGAISTDTSGKGDAGNVNITAEEVLIDGKESDSFTGISTDVLSTAEGNAGGVKIEATTIEVLDGSQISANTKGNGNAGTVNINAERVLVDGKEDSEYVTGIRSSVDSETALGNAGGIQIETNSLEIKNGGEVSANTEGIGDGGDINITAKEIQILGTENDTTGVFSDVLLGAGNSGNITIQTETLAGENAAQISASTSGEGNAGIVKVTASEIKFNGGVAKEGFFTGIDSDVEKDATGNARRIEINTNSLELKNGAGVTSKVVGTGDGGDIQINAQDITVSGAGNNGLSAISTEVETNEVETNKAGNAGNIQINTTNLTLNDSATVNTTTKNSKGSAGSINIQADNLQVTNYAQIEANSQGGAVGNIQIKTDTLNINSGGAIRTSTSGESNAGNINLEAKESLNLQGEGSGVFAETTTNSTGAGGNITSNSPSVNLTNGVAISVNSQGVGRGGEIQVTGETLNLDNNAQITAESKNGSGGNVNLEMSDFTALNGESKISATAGTEETGGGDGGNVTLKSNSYLILEGGSEITANAFEGAGGNIAITSQAFFRCATCEVTASNNAGLEGNVDINTPEAETQVENDTTTAEVKPPQTIVTQNCPPKNNEGVALFIGGRGAFPPRPTDPLNPPALISFEIDSSVTLPSPITSEYPPVAQGWQYNEQGGISFTAVGNAGVTFPGITPPPCEE